MAIAGRYLNPISLADSTRTLADEGHGTRAIQHYMGHRNIQHTVRYAELSPDRSSGFWKD